MMMSYLELYPRNRLSLRLKYATYRGGLLLPQLFHKYEYSLFESLKSVFIHQWLFGLLFDGDKVVIPAQPLLYLLSSSLWQSNLRHLTKDIHRISFEEVRQPNLETNNRLHDHRESLSFMKPSLSETIKFVPSAAAQYFHGHNFFIRNAGLRWKSETPVETHQRILDEVIELDRFLIETFQLLMSCISVQDSQLSIEQSQRATRLTLLAFVYVSLSFLTGIFGMNVREISGTGLSIWVCFVTLIVIIILTAALIWLFYTREKRKKGRGKRLSV